jgi:FlaA1/EpsC-like NDP-sugar epimerase
VAKGVVAGSALAAAGLTLVFGWAGFSKPLMVLDAILLFLLLVGSRALFRIVIEHLAGFPEDGVPILLVGAGAEGDLALRSLRIRGGVRPVGVLDEDPRTRGRFFHGLPVLGTPADLERVLRERPAVKEVVLARASEPAEQERVREVARAAGAKLMLAPTALRFTEI